MMSDGPEEVLYNAAGGMHQNTLKLFDNFAGVTRAQYEANLERFLSRTVARHSFDDLSLNLLYLETADTAVISEEYRDEALDGIEGMGQVKRVSAYAYYVDATLPRGKAADLSFLRS